jgi:hypothetical protein
MHPRAGKLFAISQSADHFSSLPQNRSVAACQAGWLVAFSA